MAKLADIDAEIRTIGKILGILFVLGLFFFLVFKGIQLYIQLSTPPAPPKAAFGPILPIAFPAGKPVNLTYRVNTLDGNLPPLPDRMNVYKVKKQEPNLVALENARKNVANVGFNLQETKLSNILYQWSDSAGNKIQYDTGSKNFKILSTVLVPPDPQILKGDVSSFDGAFATAKNFLEGIGASISDIDQEKSRGTFLKIENGAVVEAKTVNEAQFMKLDLFQKNIEEYPVYYPGLNTSTMNFIFETEQQFPKIAEASFVHHEANLEQLSDYPIKTSEEAYQDLEKGEALIFYNGNETSGPIDITEVELGYYIGIENQEYFLPIVVFKGASFTAYVGALSQDSNTEAAESSEERSQ